MRTVTVIACCVATSGLLYGQGLITPPKPLQATTIYNITSTLRMDCGIVLACIDNRSQQLRQNNYHAYRAYGTGTWSVDMQWADGTPSNWVSYGNTAQTSNASPPSGIGFGLDPTQATGKKYHDYVRFVFTGTVTVQNYWGTKDALFLNTVGAISYPLTVNQGGTGSSLDYGGVRNLGYLASFSGAVDRTVQSKLGDVVSVKDFGATGNGSTDDTASFQAALLASTDGQVLYCPQGIYNISSALTLPAYITFRGVHTDLQSGHSVDGGCTLKWAGAAPAVAYATGSAILNVHGSNGTVVDGINLDGSNTTNLTGYMVDAFAGGTSQRNSYRSGVIQHFGNVASNVAGAAMSFGDNDIIGGEQVDGVVAADFLVVDAYIGVRIKNANFAYGQFRNFAMGGINKGFDIEYSGYHTVDHGAFGTMMGTDPSVIYINGPHGPVTYNQIQAENDISPGMNAKFFNITSGTATQPSTITLTGNTLGFPSVISGANQKLVSIGNDYAGQTITLSGTDIFVTSIQDDLPDANIIISGTNSNWHTISQTPSSSVVQVIESNYAVPTFGIMEFRQRVGSGVTEPFNLMTGITGQQWKNVWSSAIYGVRDTTASDFLGFSIDKGLSGSDGLFVKHGYAQTLALRLGGQAADPFPAGTGGWWTLAGVGPFLSTASPISTLGVTSTCLAVGPKTSPVTFPLGGACTLFVNNQNDSGPTRAIFRASTTAQGGQPLIQSQDTAGIPRWGGRADGNLFVVPKGTYANNAAAIVGGLIANDVYAVAGTDPRQLAVVF